MNIALVAHDNKKELMTQFCTAYCGILAQHTLCATSACRRVALLSRSWRDLPKAGTM